MMADGDIVYGPEFSFYDETMEREFIIIEEIDGLFLEFRTEGGKKQIAGITLVQPQLEELKEVLKRHLKRLK